MFDKYVYVFVDALLPRIALPCKDTRALLVVARERTLRAVLADAVERDALFVATRETTLRDVVPRDVVVVRGDAVVARDVVVAARDADVVVGVAVPVAVRETAARDETLRAVVPVDVSRETVLAESLRDVAARDVRDVLPARDACGVATAAWVAEIGAIGSAKTARMDNKVEQTKNAPANKNTVPTAFLQKSAILRLFINYSPVFRGTPENPLV